MADHLVDGPPNKRQKLADTGLSSDSADFSRLWDLENELPEELMGSGGGPPLGDLSGGPTQSTGAAQQNGTGGEEATGPRHQQLSQLLQSNTNHGSPKELGGGPKRIGGPMLNGPMGPMGQARPPTSLGGLLGPNSPHGGPSGMVAAPPGMKGPGGAMGQASFHGGYGQVMSMGQLSQSQQRPMGANLGAALGMPPRYSSVDSSQLQNRTVQVHLEPHFVSLEAADKQASSVCDALCKVTATQRKFRFAQQTEQTSAPKDDEFTLVQHYRHHIARGGGERRILLLSLQLVSVAILHVLCRVASRRCVLRSGYLRRRILWSRYHGSAICAIAGARWCEEAWEVYDPDDGEESSHNQANREWTFAARCRWMTVDAGWRSSLSSNDNDDRPQPSEIANAVTILSSVYGDDVTLAQIRANQIASKRSLRQASIKDFFKPA
ncbi:hypothetical protein HPB51_016977 [Rhipicephalus microplus]|uniref:Uncharacterized protein n=1 Tax=Rhipicephalus microplus TaxID=6941 RepID=A0A9J6F4S9_RHIMP|nr:hypothetical protein HPB51_016977 [Rhipicephalus microplus]